MLDHKSRFFALSFFLLISACASWPIAIQPDTYSQGLYYAKVANAAYSDAGDLESSLQPLQLKLIKTNKQSTNEMQYFLARKDNNEQVIALRGTASVDDVIIDARFVFVKDENLGINVHKGFDNAAREILKEIRPSLDKTLPVYVTGHSLGGAVAVVVGMYLQKEGYNLKQIFTYGQPKVTDRRGAKLYQSLPLIRFTNEKDIVPLVPPLSRDKAENWDTYWHVANEILMYPDGSRYTLLSADASTLRGLTKYYDDLVKNRKIDAHSIVNYLQQLDDRNLKVAKQIDLLEK